MVQCVVISDEITGGSAVGAMLEKNKSKVCALINSRCLKDKELNDFDCIVYSTNSRNLSAEQSYQLVFYAAKLLKRDGVNVYAKRIDPSMRGNTCTETQAMLDALGDSDRVAIVVPAFPALKRSNVGGYILVDGKPLQKALSGLDSSMPDDSGRVTELFAQKFKYKTSILNLNDFYSGVEHLSERIRQEAEAGARAIVLDCASQEDISLIADALLLSKVKFLAVDPGPFTATLARKVKHSNLGPEAEAKIFGMVGGSNPMISTQLELLRLEERPLIVQVRSRKLLGAEDTRNLEIERVVKEVVSNYDRYEVAFAVSDRVGSNPEQIQDFNKFLGKIGRTASEAADMQSSAYGEIALKVLRERKDVGAIYTTGSDYTVAVCRELKCIGFRVQGQILPLTSYGSILGGEYDGMKYASSSSTATARNTLVESVQYLKRKLEI